MLAGSEPAVGSVRPKQPIVSPRAMGGSHRSFCSSEPNLWIALIASEPCTDTKVLKPEQAQRAHLGHELAREMSPLEPVLYVWLYPLLYKGADLTPDLLLLVGEVGFHIQEVLRAGASRRLPVPARSAVRLRCGHGFASPYPLCGRWIFTHPWPRSLGAFTLRRLTVARRAASPLNCSAWAR